jgi:hypothetical protein
MIKELERIIGDARPVSRHIARLSLSAGTTGPVYAGAASCGGEVISVYPPEYTPDETARYNGGGFHSGSVTYTENPRGKNLTAMTVAPFTMAVAFTQENNMSAINEQTKWEDEVYLLA